MAAVAPRQRPQLRPYMAEPRWGLRIFSGTVHSNDCFGTYLNRQIQYYNFFLSDPRMTPRIMDCTSPPPAWLEGTWLNAQTALASTQHYFASNLAL